jgi:hypothetical protein
MTSKQAYEYILMELRKAKAPHVHLEEFNYYINKGIQEYINIAYRSYETTQQTSDDLSALSENINGVIVNNILTYDGPSFAGTKIAKSGSLFGSDYKQFTLPPDYMHLLGIVPTLKTRFNYKCYAAGYAYSGGSTKLTADVAGNFPYNAFMRPSFNNTYYRIIDSINVNSQVPDIQVFFGNATKFNFTDFYLSYIKKPVIINLTISQRDLPIDSSQTLEFPDYVCNEIIKRVVTLLMENSQNPRLQTNPVINRTIDNLGK